MPGTTRAVRRGTRPGFLVGAAIVLLAVVKGLLWSQLVPPWYGPDELAHFTYVQDLAMTGHVQQAANGRPDGLDIPPEAICSTQALGFRSNGPFFAEPPFVPGVDPCPRPPLDTGRLPRYLSGPAGNYSPVYYGMAVPFWMAAQAGDVVTRLEAVRMLSVLLGALAALCCYLAAWWAFGGDRRLAAAAGVVFTLQPMLSQQTAIVNNDALLFTAAAAFTWAWMRALVGEPTLARMVGLGALVGVAFLAKPHGALLAPLIPLVVLRDLATRRSLRALGGAAASIAAAGAAALAVAASAIVLQRLLHGSPVPVTPAYSTGPSSFHTYLALLQERSYHRLFLLLVQSFWGDFAWLSVPQPAIVYVAITVVLALAGLGLLVTLARRRLPVAPLLASGYALLVVAAGLFAIDAVLFRQGFGYVIQGRSFMIGLVPFSLLLVAGLAAPLPYRLRGAGAALVCIAAMAVQLCSLGMLLESLWA